MKVKVIIDHIMINGYNKLLLRSRGMCKEMTLQTKS